MIGSWDLWWNTNVTPACQLCFKAISSTFFLVVQWCHCDKFELQSESSGGGFTSMAFTHLLHFNLKVNNFTRNIIVIWFHKQRSLKTVPGWYFKVLVKVVRKKLNFILFSTWIGSLWFQKQRKQPFLKSVVMFRSEAWIILNSFYQNLKVGQEMLVVHNKHKFCLRF